VGIEPTSSKHKEVEISVLHGSTRSHPYTDRFAFIFLNLSDAGRGPRGYGLLL